MTYTARYDNSDYLPKAIRHADGVAKHTEFDSLRYALAVPD